MSSASGAEGYRFEPYRAYHHSTVEGDRRMDQRCKTLARGALNLRRGAAVHTTHGPSRDSGSETGDTDSCGMYRWLG